MYNQTLYKVIEPIKHNTIKRLNKLKSGNMAITKNMM